MLSDQLLSMNDTKTQPKQEEEQNDDEVLPQIGEDPGLPADAIEQDSKARTDKERHKQENDRDLTNSKE